MSTQKGNVKRQRGQKHQNAKAFKNDLYDKTFKTQMINRITVVQCCRRCTDIIEWKIKYKKYKPLTRPSKCTRCLEKAVKRAYCMICETCAKASNVCMKCGEVKDIVNSPRLTEEEEATQMARLEQELKLLPERKRRTFLRLQESGEFKSSAKDCGAKGDYVDADEESTDSEDATDKICSQILDCPLSTANLAELKLETKELEGAKREPS